MAIKFGIIGCGAIAHRFAHVVSTTDGVDLCAVASQDIHRATEFSRPYNVTQAFDSYEALTALPDIQAVYIANTHNLHYDSIMMCLAQGKAVLCEKPMVLTQAEAIQVYKAAKERHLLIMEAMWTRFLPSFLKAKAWLDEGLIGPAAFIQAVFSFNRPFDASHRLFNPSLAGGSLYDTGVYPIELALGLTGQRPTDIKGVCMKGESGVDESVSMSLKFPGGVLAMLGCGFRAKVSGDAWIYGADGAIVIRQYLGSTRAERFDAEGQQVELFEEPCEDGFIYQIQHFADLYRSGCITSPIVPPADTIACARIFDELMTQWSE